MNGDDRPHGGRSPHPDDCRRCGGTGVISGHYDNSTGRWNSDDCPDCDGGRE